LKALIVDDSPTNTRLLQQLVSMVDGCETTVFTDPLLVLETLPRSDYDIALIDYMMPGLDGIGLIGRIRQMPHLADIPLVMVTTSDERAVRHMALNAGATDFLTKPIDPIELRSRVRNLLALRGAQKQLQARNQLLAQDLAAREGEIVLCLSRAAEYRDPETGAHILRMAKYCRVIGEALGLDALSCTTLYLAAQMHDIGKIGVSDGILLKSGGYTPEERRIMEMHTVYGHRILQGSNSELIRMASEIARSHHERWDGTGYPDGLGGESIPLGSRIAAVADVFDALTSVRPYKPAWSADKARQYLADNSGSQFDPACVTAFVSRWPEVLAIHSEGHPPLALAS